MGEQMPSSPDPLDIPDFLKRDSNNRAPFMSDVDTAEAKPVKAKTVKTKANGHLKEEPAKKASPKKEKVTKTKAKAAAKPEKEAKAKTKVVEKDQFGLRKGSSRSAAAAMYARKSGATLEEVKEKVGSIQLNVLNDLKEAGFEVRQEKQERKGKRPITRYWLTPKK